MSAPILGGNWESELRSLQFGWDSYDGKPITEAAIETVKQFAIVPSSHGGVQIEIHRDRFDIEICIGADGRIDSALVCCEQALA